MTELKERYTGCLLGGAAGDALGGPIEFLSNREIQRRFGPTGLDHYIEGTDQSGYFTDDTQMILFSAEGILRAYQRNMLMGPGDSEMVIVYQSYLRWLHTQGGKPVVIPEDRGVYDVNSGWLIKHPELFVRMAPGSTCLSALESGKCGTVREPINHSKGCGGIMRAAPFGLFYHQNNRMAFEKACDAAAITHGHPSGYLSAGCLASVIACILCGDSLLAAIETTVDVLRSWKNHEECFNAIEKAISLYQSVPPKVENIESLGGAWVGEETLSIALFCALHFQADFRGGVLAAINHGGDSDSTGAVTGNILGALLGKDAIPGEWVKKLKQADLVEEMAGDLFIRIKGDSNNNDPAWWQRYPGF